MTDRQTDRQTDRRTDGRTDAGQKKVIPKYIPCFRCDTNMMKQMHGDQSTEANVLKGDYFDSKDDN